MNGPTVPTASARAGSLGPAPAPETVTALLEPPAGEATPAPAFPRPRTPEPAELNTPRVPRTLLSRLNSRALHTHFGTGVGVVILAVLLWRLGTGVLLDGLRRIDTVTLLAALAIGVVTTVFSAWRWQLVARGLRIRLPFGPALADYYRALFLNAALPGGILGDVHRAVRHGQSAGDLRRGVKTVVLERVAGQIALTVFGAAVLLTLPSPVRDDVRGFAPLAALAAMGALAVVVAVRMNRASTRRRGALRATLGEARQGLLSRQAGPGVALSSAVILAGHVAMFVVAARVAGSAASVPVLLPLAVLALVAMGLPLNVGGFGPREGVTAWAFGAAGLGASNGVAVAVVYGVLSFVASLPGAVVLVARWYTGLRGYPRTPSPSPDVSNAYVAPKDSTRLASSSFPFSADPREGRPMTPDSV
ncbi:lysylphosphatidylglycerol synthase domain-containing protein [Streptomyces griseochromogenes]|uniref:lysylphosphatidylglycerol synthase transmembrane domain-containing protein n=1 Tax=Streptomyces griseochromogenes TaxID=68214 RepID=UPI00379FAFDD